jgi:glycosyltransferase involved in cell wall biosynthesis
VLTTASNKLPEICEIDGVRIHSLAAPSGGYSRAWWKSTGLAFYTHCKYGVDIVLSVSAGARAIMRKRPRDGSGPRFVVQAHGTSWGEFFSKIRQRSFIAWLKSLRNLVAIVEDLAYRRCDAFVAVGTAVQQDLCRRPTSLVVGNRPVHFIANGIDTDAFAYSVSLRDELRRSLGIPLAAEVVLSVSRLHPQKGGMEALMAFHLAALKRPDLHYIIAGSGPDESRLREYASKLPSINRIHFIGGVPRDMLRGWYSAADIFLFTTKREEGLPLNMLEARATGLPAVVSRGVAISDLGCTAIDPCDTEEVANSIISVLSKQCSMRANLLPEKYWLS